MEAWIFVFGSAAIIYISRKSLLSPQSHGFYRFFAWECILGLFLLNVRYWFVQPFTWNQLVAWVLLFASFVPLGFGVHFLRTQGRQAEKREDDSTLYSFEKTTNLVTSGIYKYIRHPLYCSLLGLTWGIFFKHITLTVVTLAVVATVFLVFTAKADEAECTRFFGSQYQDYMKRSKMFIPYIF
jgi:protein-S-isoprenylcysteine O-methyltransferase Ste14